MEMSISDDEIILRHIPGGTYWQAPGPRITSGNFYLRSDEIGLSVSRQSLTTPDQLMLRLGVPEKGSRIAFAKVSDFRALGLEVVSVPIEQDPGHSEIRAGTSPLDTRDMRKLLSKIFQLI